MNGITLSRDLVAHCLIIAAVVVGGWIMLVEPQAKELAVLETAIAETTSSEVPLTQTGIELLAAKVEQVKSRIGNVENRNALAHDSSRLYSTVMELGTEHGVVIERLRPGSDQRKVAGGKATATKVDITLKGNYETIARFLDDVMHLPGFVRPVSLTVNPFVDANADVSVRVVCEALSFEMPDELALTTEGADHVEF